MYLKKLIILILSFLFIGCVSIPPEAPKLSTELGKRINSIESANIKLLNKFFDQKRDDIDEFINEEWTPLFAKNIFSNSKISKIWDTIVKENKKQDRLTFLVKMGPKLQNKINEKRLELITPIDELESTIEKAIRTEYRQARVINNSITSLLVSASEVSENRDRYLGMLGATDNKIVNVIDKTDDFISKLLKKSKDAPSKVDKAQVFIKKMNSLRDSI